jgi:hypothetical protein
MSLALKCESQRPWCGLVLESKSSGNFGARRLLVVCTGKAEKERAGNMSPAPFESGPFFLEALFLTAWE